MVLMPFLGIGADKISIHVRQGRLTCLANTRGEVERCNGSLLLPAATRFVTFNVSFGVYFQPHFISISPHRFQ